MRLDPKTENQIVLAVLIIMAVAAGVGWLIGLWWFG